MNTLILWTPGKRKEQDSVSSDGRPGTCSPGNGLVAVEEDHSRSYDLVAVFCPVHGSADPVPAGQNCGPCGIPNNNRQGKPEVQMVIMGCIRPENQTGSVQKPITVLD